MSVVSTDVKEYDEKTLLETVYKALKTEKSEEALRKAIVVLGSTAAITLDTIKLLIKVVNTSANINAQDEKPGSKKTALHLAIIHQKAEVIPLLLVAKARYDIEDDTPLKKTALCYAAETTNPIIKREMLKAVAENATAAITGNIQFVSPKALEQEALTQGPNAELYRFQLQANPFVLKIINVLGGILLLIGKGMQFAGKVSPAANQANIQTVESIRALFFSFGQQTSCNYFLPKFQLTRNYCGRMTFLLYCKVIQHKAIRNGKINVVTIDWRLPNGKGHSLILLNGHFDNDCNVMFNDNTILCNPSSSDPARRFFIGERAILKYFSDGDLDVAYPGNGSVYMKMIARKIKASFNTYGNTTPIAYENLLFLREETTSFIQDMQKIFFESLLTGDATLFTKHIEAKFMALYNQEKSSGTMAALSRTNDAAAETVRTIETFYLEIKTRGGLVPDNVAGAGVEMKVSRDVLQPGDSCAAQSAGGNPVTMTSTTSQYLIQNLDAARRALIVSKGGKILDSSAIGTRFELPAFALKKASLGGIREALGLIRVAVTNLTGGMETQLQKEAPGITIEIDPEKRNRRFITFDKVFESTVNQIINPKPAATSGPK